MVLAGHRMEVRWAQHGSSWAQYEHERARGIEKKIILFLLNKLTLYVMNCNVIN